jgi:diguanylate cyclase (GGDEF)-like protein/PAS domain S-box-containing protein
MSNTQTTRTLVNSPDAGPGGTTTLVGADDGVFNEDSPELHAQLRAQLKEVRLRTSDAAPDLTMLLRLISAHYDAIDEERRGIVQSMRLMADEARAMAHEAREQSSEHLQVILDHIKDVVLMVDEDGVIQTFNPTGERVFGYVAAEVVGQRIDQLIPKIATHESITQALHRLAATSGDTHLDLASRELWAQRKAGELFPAEVAVSKARLSRREMFVLCLRDVTERRESEQAMRESEARYRLLVDHAPEAIVVFDADEGRFVDANEKAEKLFGLERTQLLKVGAVDVSPVLQPDGTPSVQLARTYTQQALAGHAQVYEWVCHDSCGNEIFCEVRLVRLPSGTRRLVRGSIADISDRKRAAIERRQAEEALRISEAKFRGLFESIAEGVYQSGRDGRLLSVNPAFVTILGYVSTAELYALPSVAMLYWNPADRTEFMRRVESEGEIRNAEFAMRTRDGQQVVILENARAVRDSGDRIVGYEGTIANITERKRAEQAIFAEKERAQVTLQSIGDAVISTDADGRIEYINPVAESLTAWSLAEARGRPIGDVLNLVNEITREPIENPLICALGRGEAGAPVDHSVLITRAGQEVAIQESAAPICDRQGRVIGAVIVFHDVTKERRLKRALSYQASHDALTGLINRREFDNRLHAAVLSAQRGEGAYALLYIDLDQFKVVNDTCGHQAGDRLLRDVTGLLQTRVRASDTIARLGGDEFGVLLEGCTPEQASRIADGVRQAIKDYRFMWGASTLSVGASVGVVQIRAETESVAAVMSAADIACYAAKDEGRNRIHVYEADGVSNRHREMHWVARVTRAAEENRLELFFQPIVRIGSEGSPDFHELTVRLRDDDGRLVPPSEFIPAAERYNVMSIIDRWVVVRAVELLKHRRDTQRSLPMLAVNLSGTSLNEQSFAEFVLQTVGEPEIASALCFEITETAAVTSLSNAAFFMRELKARGCRFSLDDFGTGLSSFMYLKTLPVDYLKIDGQFISQIATDAVDRSMVEAISKVGRALGIATVAECVESEAVLEELKRIGVDFAQGYYIANPLPIAELAR